MTDSRAIVEGPVPGDPFFTVSGIQLDATRVRSTVGLKWRRDLGGELAPSRCRDPSANPVLSVRAGTLSGALAE